MIYNKSQQSRKTAGLCPNELAGKQKSAICKIANDTLINSVKLCLAVAKLLDTDVNIITDLFAIVNPPGEKSILTANVYSSERLFL